MRGRIDAVIIFIPFNIGLVLEYKYGENGSEFTALTQAKSYKNIFKGDKGFIVEKHLFLGIYLSKKKR